MLIHIAPDCLSYTRVTLIVLQVARLINLNPFLWFVIRPQH